MTFNNILSGAMATYICPEKGVDDKVRIVMAIEHFQKQLEKSERRKMDLIQMVQMCEAKYNSRRTSLDMSIRCNEGKLMKLNTKLMALKEMLPSDSHS